MTEEQILELAKNFEFPYTPKTKYVNVENQPLD